MLAYGYQEFGGPTVFRKLSQLAIEPAADQLLIEPLAIHLTDEDRVERLGGNPDIALPYIPGHDVVGRVTKTGAAVTEFSVGAVVAAHTNHTYAEQVCLASDSAIALPDGFAPVKAASLITPGITAYKTIRYFADVQTGQTVIVKGAGTATGQLLVQLAKQRGAHVIAIADRRFADLMEAFTVDQFVDENHQNPDHVLADQGDVVINVTTNGEGGKDDLAMAKFNATIASLAPYLPATSKSIHFQLIQPTEIISDQAALQMLFKLANTAQLTATIDAQLPFNLDGIIQGHTLLDEPHIGQIVAIKS